MVSRYHSDGTFSGVSGLRTVERSDAFRNGKGSYCLAAFVLLGISKDILRVVRFRNARD
jgi:hypothetical protein